MMPKLNMEDLKHRLYGNGAEVWEVEILIQKAEALDDLLDACICNPYGECLWCGGKLYMDDHETGYTNQGQHEEDCIFLPFIQ